MNRIAGMFNFDGEPVHPADMHRMLVVQKHQDGDEPGTWIHGGVGLGCIRTGDNTRREHSPGLCAQTPGGQCTLTFDGRIDNREQLLTILQPQLLPGRAGISDEALVLAAYEKWELGCPGHLLGDFAFAIWDAKKNQLLCARDHFGVKPFYYSLSKDSFVFGSTPAAILASGRFPPLIHEARIADHLVAPLEGLDKTSSLYKDVYRLPPAHMLIVRAGGMTLERYWEFCPTAQAGMKTDDDYLEAFRELLTESVRCRLRDVTVPAAMLSGGMDSSAIVGMGRKILAEEGQCLHALAIISNSPDTNRETSYISSVLDQGSVHPHLISGTELIQQMGGLTRAIELEAEPFDCLMNLNRAVYLHARERGINSLLDGVDGDVLLSNSGHLTALWRQGAFGTIIGETIRADGLTAEYKMQKRLLLNSLLSALTPIAPDWLRKLRWHHRYGRAAESGIGDSIIDREFAINSRLGERLSTLDSHSPRSHSFAQMDAHRIALEHPFLTVGLERYERVASSLGVEARHPFIDVRLAEFCLGLPWQLKTQHGWTKMILRRAMEPYLPSKVIWRRDKDSLMWEVNRMVLKERAEYFYQITCDERAYLKPYVDLPKLMKLWQEYLTLGHETHAVLIWSGVALAMWLRRHRNMLVSLRDNL